MQHFSPIKKRILEYLNIKGVSKYQFYNDSGITRGVLDKKSGISEDNVSKFIAYEKNINLKWLIKGEGPMLKQQSNKSMVSEDLKDQYIIELQKKQIQYLENQIDALKKELASHDNYYMVAEPSKKLK